MRAGRIVDCLIGGGTMGALMRAHRWEETRLGPVELWPQSLRTSVSICLNSRFAVLLWWGPDLVMLYNDGYREIIGDKHPAALGMPGRQCFPEIWDIIGPMLNAVISRGEASLSDDALIYLERHGYREECYFTFAFSAIRDEHGGIGGVFTPVVETSEKVIGSRRLHILQNLAKGGRGGRDAKSVCANAATVFGANPADVTFSAAYLFTSDGEKAELVARSGNPPNFIQFPSFVSGS